MLLGWTQVPVLSQVLSQQVLGCLSRWGAQSRAALAHPSGLMLSLGVVCLALNSSWDPACQRELDSPGAALPTQTGNIVMTAPLHLLLLHHAATDISPSLPAAVGACLAPPTLPGTLQLQDLCLKERRKLFTKPS